MTAEAAASDIDPGPALAALWRAVAGRMADLPVYNPRLDVRATRFRRCGDWRVGVVVTPWFMNAVAVPDRPEALPAPGSTVEVPLPEGVMDAVVAALDGFGPVALASLFSPMDDFDAAETAFAVAEAALDELLRPPPAPLAAPVDRRGVLFGFARERHP